MIYPLLFKPIHKKMIWGSERWDISCRQNEMSIVENGPLSGTPLGEIYAGNNFPLLVKIIEANDDLSIQVHPSDEYAALHGFESGKSEMWYILDAPENGHLIIGLADGATPDKLLEDPMSCLKKVQIKKGDMIDIPAGLIHAITKGVKLAEIQQNSDVTFRLYDYGRTGQDGKPRELHLDHGIAMATMSTQHMRYSEKTDKITNKHFTVSKIQIDGTISENADSTFNIITCVEGSCAITCHQSTELTELTYSRSAYIPAKAGAYTISGHATLLKTQGASY